MVGKMVVVEMKPGCCVVDDVKGSVTLSRIDEVMGEDVMKPDEVVDDATARVIVVDTSSTIVLTSDGALVPSDGVDVVTEPPEVDFTTVEVSTG